MQIVVQIVVQIAVLTGVSAHAWAAVAFAGLVGRFGQQMAVPSFVIVALANYLQASGVLMAFVAPS